MGDEIRVHIDRDECIMCGACYDVCPEVFQEGLADGLSQVIEAYRVNDDPAEGLIPADLEDCVRAAALDCPVEIIRVG